jgi:hypothetical protein
MAHRKRKRAGKKRSPKRKGKRRGGFTRASALASMNHCGKCGRTIFGGPKGLATHRRKSCGKKKRRRARR